MTCNSVVLFVHSYL